MGKPVGLPLLWFSRGDEDLLMAAGTLITPHLFPYHFILLMPALARMRWPWAVLTWTISWTPAIAANALGSWGWHAGNLLSLCFWLGICLSGPRPARPGDAARPQPAVAKAGEPAAVCRTGLRCM